MFEPNAFPSLLESIELGSLQALFYTEENRLHVAAPMRCGSFKLTLDILARLSKVETADGGPCRDLFSRFAILQTQALVLEDAVEFIALSPLFDAIQKGEPIPRYIIFARACGPNALVRVSRKDS